MRFYLSIKALLISALFLCPILSLSQRADSENLTAEQISYINSRTKEEYAHIESAFRNMFEMANASYNGSNSHTCDALGLVKNLDNDKFIVEGFPSSAHIGLDIYFKEMISGEGKLDLEGTFDKGNFKTLEDKLLSAASNSNNFDDFMLLFGERSVARLTSADEKQLRKQYDRAKTMRVMDLNDDGGEMAGHTWDQILISETCSILMESYLVEKKYNYPNSEWKLISRLSYDCECTKGSNETTLNKAQYEYTANINSLRTATNIVFDKTITQPKLSIKKVVCCPEKTTSEEASSAEPNSNITSRILSDHTPNFGVESSTETQSPLDDEAIEVKLQQKRSKGTFGFGASLGTTIGEEKDFYGVNYGANAGYIFEFNDSKFSAGPEVEYSRFTGKETDFGFETEGVGFLNIKARANYSLTDWLGASAGAGYGIGLSEGVDGGIGFDVGAEISPLAAKRQDVSSSTRIYYSLRFKSNSVEGGSFKSINAGVGIKLN